MSGRSRVRALALALLLVVSSVPAGAVASGPAENGPIDVGSSTEDAIRSVEVVTDERAGDTKNSTDLPAAPRSFDASSSQGPNGTVYVGSRDNSLYAIDTATGDVKWSYATGNSIYSSPTVAGGTVYVGSDDSVLYAINASSGTEEWAYTTGDSISSSPTVVNGTVYVGSGDNRLYAIDASSGTEEWNYSTGSQIESSPTVVDGTVYVGNGDYVGDNLYAIDAGTGQLDWSFSTGDSVYSSPTVSDGTVYVGSTDNSIYAVDAETGAEEWSYSTGNQIYSSPTVVDGTVYVGSTDNNLYALNASSGTEQWTFSTGNNIQESSPTVSDGTVYVGSADSNLYAVDASTGEKVWNYSTGGSIYESSATVAEGTVYIGSNDNSIHAVDAETGTKEWSYSTGGIVSPAPTVITADSSRSDGSRVLQRTLGHHEGSLSTTSPAPITGHITDRVGERVDKATVWIYNETTDELVDTANANSTGYYEVVPKVNGTYRIEVRLKNKEAVETLTYTTSGKRLDISMPIYYSSGELEVVAFDTYTRISGIEVTARSLESNHAPDLWVEHFSNGTAEFPGMRNETYELTISADGYRTKTVIINESKRDYTVALNEEDSGHWDQEVNLVDYTGHFDPEDSWVVVKEFRWLPGWSMQDGAWFGSDDPEIQIREGKTYRVYVRNVDGEVATIGELRPGDWSDDEDHVVTFTVGEPGDGDSSSDDRSDFDDGSGDSGDDSGDDGDRIVDSPPIAELAMTPENPIIGETVELNASESRDIDGTIEAYRWEIDGEQVAAGETVSWTPEVAGTREIMLVTEDDAGQTDTESTSVYIGSDAGDRNERPTVRINASSTALNASEPVTLTAVASDPDGNVTGYRWDLDGDGTTEATGRTVDHSYDEGGLYPVVLTVRDDHGATNSTDVSISVTGELDSGGSEGSGGGAPLPVPGSGAAPDTPFGLFLFLVGAGAALLGLWYVDKRTGIEVSRTWLGAGGGIIVLIVIEAITPGAITIPLSNALATVGPLLWLAGIGGAIWAVRRYLKTRRTEARASTLASWSRGKNE